MNVDERALLARWRLGEASETDVIQTVVRASQSRTQTVRELALDLPIATPLRELAAVEHDASFPRTGGLLAMTVLIVLGYLVAINGG